LPFSQNLPDAVTKFGDAVFLSSTMTIKMASNPPCLVTSRPPARFFLRPYNINYTLTRPPFESAWFNFASTSILLGFDGCSDRRSTAYQRSSRSRYLNIGRWPASRNHADLFWLSLRPQCSSPVVM